MATFNAATISDLPGADALGNVHTKVYKITGNGSAGTAAAGSVLRMGELPQNAVIVDLQVYASAATTSLTVDAGYSYKDGAPAGDADAFINDGVIAVAGTRAGMNTADGPVTLLEDAYLELTTAGATLAATTIVYAVVQYTMAGAA